MTDESLRRADQLLVEMAETVETARTLPMSTSCVLPRERMLDLIDELREVLPPEMDQARSVVATRDRVLLQARERAAEERDGAVVKADAVLADAHHQAEQLLADAERRAEDSTETARAEQGRLLAHAAVHQAATEAAAQVHAEADEYRRQVLDTVAQHDRQVRDEADRYAYEVRTAAEQQAHKLARGAHDYAQQTLDEVSAVLHRAAATADQGRRTLAGRVAEGASQPDVEPARMTA